MDNTHNILKCYKKASKNERTHLFLKYRYLRDAFAYIDRSHSAGQGGAHFFDDLKNDYGVHRFMCRKVKIYKGEAEKMPDSINLNFKKGPSPFFSLVKGLWGMSRKFQKEQALPVIKAQWESVHISKKHMDNFFEICGLSESNVIPLLYPYTLIFPIYLRMLGEKKAPLSVFVVLNVRCQIIQYRRININEKLDIYCKVSGLRIVNKGMEMDITSTIKTGNDTVWENTNSFYYRGKFGETDKAFIPPTMDSIPESAQLADWFLPNGIGYRFSKIVGDNNGIHYFAPYARMFGFKRDFAQPILVLANSIRCLPSLDQDKPLQLDVVLKGPVYYNNNILIKRVSKKNSHRFDIYCGEESRPSISCNLKNLGII